MAMFHKVFCSRTPFGFEKKKHGFPHRCSSKYRCPDDRYPKLKIYFLKPILDNYEYIPVAYVTMLCMIWHE